MVTLANPIHFQIKPLSEIGSDAATDGILPGISIMMPTRSEALKLLAVYEEHIEFLHHVTYAPRTRAALDEAYEALEQGEVPSCGAAALLTAIFASATAFQHAIGDKKNLLGVSPDTASRACYKWAKATFDCTETSTRTGRCSIEDFQALITVFFLMYNLEGFSARSRMGIGLAIGIARDLGLHRVDYQITTQPRTLETEHVIAMEVKRRAFWHLTATDWQCGVTGGPQEGTYSIQPRHIATRLPRHIEEEDLMTKGPTFERPLSVPTDSSYLIQRIRLAEISRKTIDVMPLGAWGSNDIRYEDILALDLEFERFERELPPFFQNTTEASQRWKDVYARRPSILVQKYTVNIISQNRRCKLHQPWLVRGFADPTYARSRDVCLTSARTVIAISKQLDSEKIIAASLLSMSGVHHHMFFAAVALVMDLCFNKTEGEDETARRAEVMDACHRLGQAKDRSPVAKKFLDSLMDVMRKHKIRCFDAAPVPEASPPPPVELQALPSELPDFDPTGAAQSDFEEIWQSYIENGASLDVPDWTELYDDLQDKMR